MSDPRRPAAFGVPSAAEPAAAPRAPRSIELGDAVVAAEQDFFEQEALRAEPPPALPRRRRSRLWPLFLSSMGVLVSLAVALWAERLIRDLFSRSDWLGWSAAAVAALAALTLLAILLREALALFRLASVERLRQRAAAALAGDDAEAARSVAAALSALLASRPETAAGRRALDAQRGEVIDGPDLLRLAETALLAPLDARARELVLDAAKRVSLVTAVSPRALVDLAYVMFESGRLIRRLAELYGGRPGALGFLRLTRSVLAHLAVTGSIAAGDSVVQQLVGHGVAARLSARLGEGVVNGMMTARIGVAAMEAVRPLPFTAVPRPRIGDFLAVLTRFAARSGERETGSERLR